MQYEPELARQPTARCLPRQYLDEARGQLLFATHGLTIVLLGLLAAQFSSVTWDAISASGLHRSEPCLCLVQVTKKVDNKRKESEQYSCPLGLALLALLALLPLHHVAFVDITAATKQAHVTDFTLPIPVLIILYGKFQPARLKVLCS